MELLSARSGRAARVQESRREISPWSYRLSEYIYLPSYLISGSIDRRRRTTGKPPPVDRGSATDALQHIGDVTWAHTKALYSLEPLGL